MATYKIETDRGTFEIDGPDDATHDELMQAVEDHMHGTPQEEGSKALPEAPAERTDTSALSNVVGSLRHGQPQEGGPLQVAKDALQVSSIPVRGLKGLATGVGDAIATKKPLLDANGPLFLGEGAQESLQRAVAATKPNYEPQTGAEKKAALIASLADPRFMIPIGKGAQVAKAGVQGAARIAGDIAAPTVAEAGERLLPALEKAGLKDIKPIIFNKGERDQAVKYAETVLKQAKDKLLKDPKMLQEARATLKDVLDNGIVKASSPSGQTIARAKDAATAALHEVAGEATGEAGANLKAASQALQTQGRAYAAVPTKKAIARALATAKRAAITAAVGTPIASAIYKVLQ